jgi:hypothetical protein
MPNIREIFVLSVDRTSLSNSCDGGNLAVKFYLGPRFVRARILGEFDRGQGIERHYMENGEPIDLLNNLWNAANAKFSGPRLYVGRATHTPASSCYKMRYKTAIFSLRIANDFNAKRRDGRFPSARTNRHSSPCRSIAIDPAGTLGIFSKA